MNHMNLIPTVFLWQKEEREVGLASLNPTGFRVAMDMTNHEANIIVCFAAGAEDCDIS